MWTALEILSTGFEFALATANVESTRFRVRWEYALHSASVSCYRSCARYAKGCAILFLVIISWSALYVPYAVTSAAASCPQRWKMDDLFG